jgi:hypothetical protein
VRRSTKYKTGSFLLLASVLIGFNQCIKPMGSSNKSNLKYSSSTNTTSSAVGVSKTVSVDTFSKTVYTITKNRCSSCHGTMQTPLHASSDVTIAHDAVLNSAKVDLNNPANSRLVLKLKNEKHNCWGDCNANATEMENQIINWKNLIGNSGSSSSTISGKTTKESNTVTNLLNPTGVNSDNTYTLMTEGASLKSPMMSGFENGTSFVYVPTTVSTKSLTSSDYGAASLNFSVNMADFYHMFIYVNSSVETASGLYVKAAGSDYKEFTIGVTNGFEWRKVTNTTQKLDTEFYINANVMNNIELRQKNSGIKIAKVILTNDSSYDPGVSLPMALAKATISLPIADISGVADAIFEIDIEDFDQYSYKISNPRVRSSKSLVVKKLKVLVNNSYNSQHSTYLVVDKTVTPNDPILSNYYMILLKDKGPDLDKLSFSFETIEAAK